MDEDTVSRLELAFKHRVSGKQSFCGPLKGSDIQYTATGAFAN